ncbi:MAG: hypothetical protein O7B99_11510 [Planctomycetota bacterium]|nr:hypothetical protein [Planctomycetota bacterium]
MKAGFLASAIGLATLAGTTDAQSNVVPGLDVQLAKMDQISALGRVGTYPNGMNGVAQATTACNKGTVKVPWEQAMDPDHPFITFLVGRETDGRLTQISDYSYVKHGFFALTSSFCDTCQEGPFGGGDILGLGCSDTYSVQNNGDNYWLAPAEEIDPWLGFWDPICSHFDMGEPAVNPPFDCDGNRSLTSGMATALGPVGHRINIPDQEFLIAGDFYYQGYYVVEGEAESLRENNLLSRTFTPSWSGTKWNLPSPAGSVEGSILERWSGATVTSEKNGNDDGRVYVALKVTGPTDGLYHYEYAIHNRDNFRGVSSLSIPICSGARVLNTGSSDLDGHPANNWTVAVGATDVTFSTNINPVRWNTFYNFWFDSDAAPLGGTATLDQFDPGAGAASIALTTGAPLGLYNVYLGDGCSGTGSFPVLSATGNPPQATLGNPTFGFQVTGSVPNQMNVLVLSLQAGAIDVGGGCTQWFGGTLSSAALVMMTTSDGSGVASYATPVPSSPSLEGAFANVQAAGFNPGGGLISGFDLSNGLQVRVGDSVSGCP